MQNFTLKSVSDAFESKVNLTIEMTKGGKDVHVLIITDHFTRYTQALVTTSQTAKCTAQALWD